MRLLSIDAWITILSGLGCYEWQQLIYTSKYFANILRTRFLHHVKLFAVSRLRNMLAFLDFDYFTRLIRREGGEIGGSIHAQLFTNDFKANDIDIFIQSTRSTSGSGYSPLHRYLFSVCKRAIPISDYKHASPDYVYRERDAYKIKHAYKVMSVWNFDFVCTGFDRCTETCEYGGEACKCVTLQVVTIEDSNHGNFIPMYKRIQDAIGDFTITQSTYNGRCYTVRGMLHILAKRLVCMPNFVMRVTLFTQHQAEKHTMRIAKYNMRGFTLYTKLPYRTNIEILEFAANEPLLQLTDIPQFLLNRYNESTALMFS